MVVLIYNSLTSRSLMESEFKSTLPTIFIFLHIMQSLLVILAFVLLFTFQATSKLNSIIWRFMKRCIYNNLASRSFIESDFKSTLPSIFIFVHIMHSLYVIFVFVRLFPFQMTTILISILIRKGKRL